MTQSNSITIGTITIHQSQNGLYLLTDLWKSSGGAKKDQPNNWLKLERTKSVISYYKGKDSRSEKKASYFLTVNGGNRETQGTYVCRNLVYDYAMWISPAFHDLVITTFDQLVNATTTQEVIDLKHQLDNALQQDLFTKAQQPRDKNCLQVLMNCTPFQVNQFYDELEYQGQVKSRLVPQPPKRVFEATEQSTCVIGKKGDTLLFDESVKDLFPAQQDWAG